MTVQNEPVELKASVLPCQSIILKHPVSLDDKLVSATGGMFVNIFVYVDFYNYFFYYFYFEIYMHLAGKWSIANSGHVHKTAVIKWIVLYPVVYNIDYFCTTMKTVHIFFYISMFMFIQFINRLLTG